MSIYRILGFLVIAAYFVLGITTLERYGINWDEVAHLTRGQAYLYFFLTGREHYDRELFHNRHSFYQIPQYDFIYQKEKDGDHPVFSDIISSLFNYIFYQSLGIINDFDAYHLYGPVLVTLFLIFLFFWVERTFGDFIAVVATLSLVLYPVFYGESHFNVQKDIPETVFFGISLLAFYNGYVKNSAKWILVSSIFFGFAWGTKFNILFLPFILCLWFLLKEGHRIVTKLLSLPLEVKISLIAFPLVGFSIFFGSWPHLWHDPLNSLLQVFGYYKQFGIIEKPSMPPSYYIFGFNTYAPQWILYTTPLVILFLSTCGTIYVFSQGRREKDKTSLLIFLWFMFPILRVMFPNTSIYGGVRQIMEYIPAMAILSGIGAGYIVTLLHGLIVKNLIQVSNRVSKQWSNRVKVILQFIVILSFIPITLKIISLHPNESIYFNPLIGGLKGAKEKNIPGWGNSLGSTYRQGVNWLNEHAEKNAKVALSHELISNIPRTLLRDDIQYSNIYRSGLKREGEYIVALTHHGTYEKFYHRKYIERFLGPIYELKVDYVPVLKIWKNDIQHTKPAFRKIEEEIQGENFLVHKDTADRRVVVEFPKLIRLTKILISYSDENCIIPREGKIRISKDGDTWTTLPGGFHELYGLSWFKPLMEKGELRYLFAADEVRYIRFSRNTQNSCLLKNPIHVRVWKI